MSLKTALETATQATAQTSSLASIATALGVLAPAVLRLASIAKDIKPEIVATAKALRDQAEAERDAALTREDVIAAIQDLRQDQRLLSEAQSKILTTIELLQKRIEDDH